jgi:hypothetical protein
MRELCWLCLADVMVDRTHQGNARHELPAELW